MGRDPEKHRFNAQVYRKKNREKVRRVNRKYKRENKTRLKIERDRRRRLLGRYKSMKRCAGCGYRKCPAALDFDHLDPESKSFNVSVGLTGSWNKLKAEMAKCRIVCSNCHREQQYEERQTA